VSPMDQNGMSETEWREVVGSLEDIGPYYEKVNMMMTFGLIDRWRRHVAALAKPGETVLEIGPGPGYFTRHLKADTIYCLEPSLDFASSTKGIMDMGRVNLVKGVAEKIPMARESVDRVFCVFSFRDFFDKPAALGEINRVLKEGGEVVVADVAKPDSGPLAKMMEVHFRRLIPVLARVAISPSSRDVWTRDPYSRLVQTWTAYGSSSDYEGLFRKSGFVDVSTEYLELKGAAMTRGKKPWTSTS
jgi:demethylmenaquinone methyltransferase/2-methoxy-6-polyprenyl-1,4-benzoquinol methylase